MTSAQLYYWDDDRNPKNAGWWFRYLDDRGNEQGYAVSESRDATTPALAAAVEAAIGVDSTLTGTIKVLRHNEVRGTIRLIDGKTKDWKAIP